jgi:hypothetical protein
LKRSLISAESSVVAIESSPADMRGASADTAEPIIVAVSALSSWIRLSRERVRDPTDVLAVEGLLFAILVLGWVYACTELYV